LTPDEAEALQRKYSTRRKRWARQIGIPVEGDIEEPDPGVIDAVDETEG
jgi:hypothetical protein